MSPNSGGVSPKLDPNPGADEQVSDLHQSDDAEHNLDHFRPSFARPLLRTSPLLSDPP